ncbi:MAG: DNA cytosine methyltransferase [Dehalococcoidia bacterium]|nr:MAG: DNA cytosine methyltransferase [Dehalococcoidia bacterium]
MVDETFPFLDFFAGSGLVTEGVKPYFYTVWANDISEQKGNIYNSNQNKSVFHLGPLQTHLDSQVPFAIVSWASFPCQDLSVAGKQEGINASRSGLFWVWLDAMDRMPVRPPIVVAENVSGLTSAEKGKNYVALHQALVSRGYRVGPILLDALNWLPQSRKRIFVIGVQKDIEIDCLTDVSPNWLHPNTVTRALDGLKDVIWWKMPKPPRRTSRLSDFIDYDIPIYSSEKADDIISLIPGTHKDKIRTGILSGVDIFPGYRRIRNNKQVLEIRADDISGCLRTANGGSSRQFIIIARNNRLDVRLLSVREAARLMGVPDSYKIPGTFNDGYNAMGDAVALPVTRFIAKELLLPLARRAYAYYSGITSKV